jgi:ubiquinone biosynthesis protein COQ4
MRLEIPPASRPRRLRWLRALREMRALFRAPDDTEHALDFLYALGSGSFERSISKTAASDAGRALLAERPCLLDALSDRGRLAAMPEDSLGRAYLAYLDRNGFQPGGLLALEHRVAARWEREEGVPGLDPLRAWFRDRGVLGHDLYHLITDYDTDDVGEAALLAFTLGQFGGTGQTVLTLGAALKCARVRGWGFLRQAFRAWQRGRRAAQLAALPWEQLLPLRLDTVRRLAGVADPERAHPDGIPRGRVVERLAH